MALASPGTRVVPQSSDKLMGGLNLSITPEDCEEESYGAWLSKETAGFPPKLSNPLSPTANRAAATNDHTPPTIDLISDSSSSSTSSYKGKLPVVLEESESFSHRESSSTWDLSSSSSISISSSSASSTQVLFRRGEKPKHKHRGREQWSKHHKRSKQGQKASLMSAFLWPFKKLRDAYMSCMMGLDGAGDLSGLAQGSTFATSTKYFAEQSISKTDAKN